MRSTNARRVLAALAALIAIGSPDAARAQGRDWPERIWIGAGGGLQLAGASIGDGFDVPLYAETEHVDVRYPAKARPVIAVNGGYRVWNGFTIGLGVTRASVRSDAAIKARVPHPFFDNRFRDIEGTASTLRSETSAHLLLGWMLPLTDRLRLIVSAGPSLISVEQTLVTGVQYAETYPYDTAEFSGATTKRSSRSASGFNAGADVMWMFTRRLGAGGLVQYSRARAQLDPGPGRTIGVDAGGASAAVGVRLMF